MKGTGMVVMMMTTKMMMVITTHRHYFQFVWTHTDTHAWHKYHLTRHSLLSFSLFLSHPFDSLQCNVHHPCYNSSYFHHSSSLLLSSLLFSVLFYTVLLRCVCMHYAFICFTHHSSTFCIISVFVKLLLWHICNLFSFFFFNISSFIICVILYYLLLTIICHLNSWHGG